MMPAPGFDDSRFWRSGAAHDGEVATGSWSESADLRPGKVYWARKALFLGWYDRDWALEAALTPLAAALLVPA